MARKIKTGVERGKLRLYRETFLEQAYVHTCAAPYDSI